MKSIKYALLAALGGAVAVVAACSSSSSGNGSGSSSGSGSGSGSSSSGSGSTSGSGSSSSGSGSTSGSSSGSGDDSGMAGDGPVDDGGPMMGNCPTNCATGQTCCLITMMGSIWGICATQSACAVQNGGYILCGSNPDTVDCMGKPGTACCLSTPDAGGIPSTYCAASCPSGTPLACNGDQTTCPNGGAGYACAPINSMIPVAALGECVPAVTGDGGPGEGGSGEGGSGDSGGMPETGVGDGATDAARE